MIVLHQFPRAFGIPNASPFCMKVETYLRLAGLEYRIEPLVNPARAPKGKAPYIVDGHKTISDSHFIIKYLKETYGDQLNKDMSTEERVYTHTISRMVEEHLYFAIMYIRWIPPENAVTVRETYFSTLPSLLRGFVFRWQQKNTLKGLLAQGIGRHNIKDIEQLAIEDLEALSALLGDRYFFGGARPREIDCTTWSFIANIINPPFKSPVRETAQEMSNLVAYNARMARRVFPDLN